MLVKFLRPTESHSLVHFCCTNRCAGSDKRTVLDLRAQFSSPQRVNRGHFSLQTDRRITIADFMGDPRVTLFCTFLLSSNRFISLYNLVEKTDLTVSV